jgi:hypothetical protein
MNLALPFHHREMNGIQIDWNGIGSNESGVLLCQTNNFYIGVLIIVPFALDRCPL